MFKGNKKLNNLQSKDTMRTWTIWCEYYFVCYTLYLETSQHLFQETMNTNRSRKYTFYYPACLHTNQDQPQYFLISL
jgi:hypothetical protein